MLLDERVHIEVLNADGATPGSDAAGDTIWTDGKKHLATVEEIARAPYAAREGMQLLGAMAFGFHGDVRTSNEGTVVINGQVHRLNPGRAALCIRGTSAQIGLFDAQQTQECEQAIGGGPVILWQGKIANPTPAPRPTRLCPSTRSAKILCSLIGAKRSIPARTLNRWWGWARARMADPTW